MKRGDFMKQKNEIYIYNPEQKDFYLQQGCQILDAGLNKRTKRVWWKFGYKETQEAFVKWVTRTKSNTLAN